MLFGVLCVLLQTKCKKSPDALKALPWKNPAQDTDNSDSEIPAFRVYFIEGVVTQVRATDSFLES